MGLTPCTGFSFRTRSSGGVDSSGEMTKYRFWSVEATKKEGILVEAAQVFQRFGFKKASIDSIAQAAGVAKGTIYLACRSKADLFYQVLHREVRAWEAATALQIDPRVPADELLGRVSEFGSRYLSERPLLRSLLFGDAYTLIPKLGNALDRLVDVGGGNVEDILELGIEQGLFRPDLDVRAVGRILLDLQISYFILHDRGRKMDLERTTLMRKTALDVVLNGIRVPARKGGKPKE